MMRGKSFVPFMLILSALVLFLFLLMQPLTILKFHENIAILFPAGEIAVKQRNLLLIIQAIMLLVIIPVYILTFVFSWKYRASNPKATYDPDLVDNKLAEIIWWGIPLVLTLVIAVLTWVKTYQLDPYKALESDKKPITIQVVALQWKWLFIYPEENVASVNFLQIPKDIPIRFEITADAPMNSFWIPHLGGQIYAMPAMKTLLHLVANKTGDFRGSSANISGEGFAGMHFIVRSSSEEEYRQWIDQAKQSPEILSDKEYTLLAAPSKNNPAKTFQITDTALFDQIIMKYMHPKGK
ncbi:Cytochrome bo(3) ubiquinol oxidase subunit 2 [Chlamydiales bacterium STE3]|nr:Cytochrome bo(3) ubiquinol oxidase subunit 2 [Chlamydiales bacterium STE3]